MKIITHPDNLALIEQGIKEGKYKNTDTLSSIEINLNPYMDRTKKTGNFILKDGTVLSKDKLAVPEGRFFEWGNSDVEINFMLKAGLIREEEEAYFVVINDSFYKYFMKDFNLNLLVQPPQYFINTMC